MSIIRPPVSGDSPQDSWANQVTEAINKGLLAPSINAAAPAANVSLNGISAATIYLYTRTDTPNAPAAVNIDITYDYKNITYSPSAPFGTANWQLSPPGTANGNYLWVTVVNISANTEKEIIPFASWSTPEILAVNGDSSFVCEAFIRLATAPGQPSGGSYNFDTTTLTTPIGSPASEVWSAAIPGGTDPVYICTAIAVITGSTGTASSLDWSQPVKMVENGTNGTNGLTGASTDIIFQRSATQPATPSASAGTPSGWYSSASSAAGTDLLWAASGAKAVGSSTFTWSAPFQIEGKAVAEVAIYRLNSNAGLVNSTYDFTTNTLTPPTGWSTSVPALSGTGDVIYRASGIVSGSALETSATVNYGSAVIFAQRTDGLTGASTNIIFRRSATAPSTPSASAGIPTGWYDSASGAVGTDVLWAASGTKAIGATNFSWTTPFQIEGEAVTEVAIYRLNSNAGLASSTYNFVTNTLTPPTGWSINAPALVSNGDIVYRASGIASGSSLETSATVSFGSAVIFAQRTDGATGASSNIIFRRSANAPATPSASSGVPTGWYDSAASAVGTNLLWASSGIKTVGATNFTWTTPFRIEGEAVVEVAVYRLNNNTGLSTGTYNFATNTLTPPTNWSTTLPSIVSNGDIVYRASGIASGSAIETSASVTFGTPVIFAQRTDGSNGTNGTNGVNGTELESGLVYYTTAQASAPGTPSASDYNLSSGVFVNLSSGWQTQPVVVNITSTTALFWSARYRVTKAAGASTATVTFNAPVASVNFGTNIQSDNYVTGSSGWQIQRASGDAEFGNITARGALESANFDGAFNSLSQTLSTYSSATGVFAANTWGLRNGFGNSATNIAATTWNDYLDPVSNTVHVVLKIRAATAAQTEIISQLGRGQQLTITRNSSNYAVFEVWTAGYLPEDANTAYVQLRTLVGTATGTPASSAITLAASNVVSPGTEGYSFDNDRSVINSGTLDVANIRINGSIQAKNLDIGITLQSKSGNRSGVNNNWLEFLRIETTDSPDFDTDVTYSSLVTVVSRSGVGDIVFVKVLDNSQLGTEGTATYSSSQIGLSAGSVTTFANTIDSASIQANSPNQSSAFTTSMSDSNVNVNRGVIYLFCFRERAGGDTAIGCNASASITEIRRP